MILIGKTFFKRTFVENIHLEWEGNDSIRR